LLLIGGIFADFFLRYFRRRCVKPRALGFSAQAKVRSTFRREGKEMKRPAVAALFCFLLPAIVHAQSWVCVADQAAGFAFDKSAKEWRAAVMRADEKFLVTRSDRSNFKWAVKSVGSDVPVSLCGTDFSEEGYLACEGFQYFRFNRKNLRFVSVHVHGYFSDNVPGTKSQSAEGEVTPKMAIGKCSQL